MIHKIWNYLCGLLILSILLTLVTGTTQKAYAASSQQNTGKLNILFVMDTSGSMDDEFSALCGQINAIVAELTSRGVSVQYQILGIAESKDCAGITIPEVVSSLTVNNIEDWGPGVRDLSVGYAWQPGAVRLIIPISDEAPEDGNDCESPGADADAIETAVIAAKANSVRVSPILGSGYDACTADLAARLAQGTGGAVFYSDTPADDLAEGIIFLLGAVLDDRDGDGIADDDDPYPDDPCQPDPQAVCFPAQVCGISNTPHWDDDGDGRTDEEIVNGTDDDGDGLIDEDAGGENCPFPKQDCGVNSHRGFDDDNDGVVDEEVDDNVDNDGDNYIDEDVLCTCPVEQDAGVNDTPGVDDDHDFRKDEEADDGVDNDGDGCIDEDIQVVTTNPENKAVEEQVKQCLSTGQVCTLALTGLIPIVGVATNAAGLGDEICQGQERFEEGDVIGSILINLRALNTAAEIVHEVGGTPTGVGVLTALLHKSIGAAADCLEALLHDFLLKSCGPKGYTCWAERIGKDLANIFPKKTTIVLVTESAPPSTSVLPQWLPILSLSYYLQFIQKNEIQLSSCNIPHVNDLQSSPGVGIKITDDGGKYIEYKGGIVSGDGVGWGYQIGPDVKMVIMEGAGENKKLEITGESDSTIGVNILQVTDEEKTTITTVNEASLVTNAVAQIDLGTNGKTSSFKIDENGDNQFETDIQPKTVNLNSSDNGGYIPPRPDNSLGIVFVIFGLAVGTILFFTSTQRRRIASRKMVSTPLAYLVNPVSGERFKLHDNFLVGRGSTCDLRLMEPAVSRRHAVLRTMQGQWFIQDQQSQIGVIVNGQRVTAVKLNPGDQIQIGTTLIKFNIL